MASDTSLVFNLIAKDQATGELTEMGQKWATAGATIGAGLAAALGVGIVENLSVEAANDKLAAQLGVGPAEAAELAQVSAKVYQDAWGESTAQVNDAIKGVYRNIGDVSEAEGGLEGVTTKALALAQTFDQDLNMATAAAGQLIRTGLADDADEAFDILAVGLGTTADKAGDLLETFNEYSTQFRRLGLDGQTATGLLVQGLEAGARDADQVADAIGIFGETALAGGTAVDEAFTSIGLDADVMAKLIGKGGDSAEKALQKTMDALRGTKNEQVALNAAGDLFGDPGKVMGKALFALDPAGAAAAAGMDKAKGAMDRIVAGMGGNAAAAFESFKRKALHQLGAVGGGFVQFAMKNTTAMKVLAGVLGTVAGVVLTVAAAQKVYAAGVAIATAANTVLSASMWPVIGGWIRMNAVGLAAMARIAAASVASAATTAAAWVGSALASIGTWIAAVVRAAVTSAAQFVMMAARAVAWAATMAAQWFIAMGPVGWVIAAIVALVVLIVANWDRVKAITAAVWQWIWNKIKAVGQGIKNAVILAAVAIYNTWLSINNKVRSAVSAAWSWVLNKIKGVMVGAKNAVMSGIARIGNAFLSIHRTAASALAGAGRWLYNAGRSIIQGLVNGIRNMAGAVSSAVSGVLKKARNLLPFSPAKEGPFSGRGWTLYSGESMMSGLAEGISRRRGVVTAAVQGMTERARQAMPGGPGGAPMTASPIAVSGGAAAGGWVLVEVDFRGADGEMARALRKMVRVKGRGNVQVAFGSGSDSSR